MANRQHPASHRSPPPADRPVPWPQLLLDDVFLLLALGLAVPMVLYVFWGLWELVQVPLFR